MRDFCKYRRIYFFYDANQFSRGYCLIDLDSVEASVHIIEYTQKVPLQISISRLYFVTDRELYLDCVLCLRSYCPVDC